MTSGRAIIQNAVHGKVSLLMVIFYFLFSCAEVSANRIEDLPDETLLHILSFLGPNNILNFGTTSKKYLAIAEDEQLWAILYSQSPEVQKFKETQGDIYGEDHPHKDYFRGFYAAITKFNDAQKSAFYILESHLCDGYKLELAYPCSHAEEVPHCNQLNLYHYIDFSKSPWNPIHPQAYLVTTAAFEGHEPFIASLRATYKDTVDQSLDAPDLFPADDTSSLFPISPRCKIVVKHANNDTEYGLKISIEPFSRNCQNIE